jgi:hypothetical protein
MASPLRGGRAGDEGHAGDGIAAHLVADNGSVAQLAAGKPGLVRRRPTAMGNGNQDEANSKLVCPSGRLGSWSSTGKTGTCDDHGHDDGVRNGHAEEGRKHKGEEDAPCGRYGDRLGDGPTVSNGDVSDDETDNGQCVAEQDITVEGANHMITEVDEVDMSYVYSIPESEGMKLWMYVPDTYATQVQDSLEDVQVEAEYELTKQKSMDVDRGDNIEYQQYVPGEDQESQVEDLIEETAEVETLQVHKEWFSNIEDSQFPDVQEEFSVGGEEDVSAQESLEVEQDILAGESQAPDSLEEIEAEVLASLGVAGEEQGEANEEHNENQAEHGDGSEKHIEPEEDHDNAEEELGEGDGAESAVRRDMLKIMLPLYFES